MDKTVNPKELLREKLLQIEKLYCNCRPPLRYKFIVKQRGLINPFGDKCQLHDLIDDALFELEALRNE